MVDLFQSSKANVSEHIRNIYDQGELEQKATVRNFRTVRKEGKDRGDKKREFSCPPGVVVLILSCCVGISDESWLSYRRPDG